LLDEARTRDPDKRAHVWRVLQDADAPLRAEPAARVAEALLRLDPARPSSPPPKEHPPDAPRGLVPRLRDEAEGLRLSARAFEYALTDYVEALRARRP
ncbi:MAG TPA: hypothetical protein VGU73_08775, partial [Acidimicrobiia bacterium]|nr:hypothetical protein [Acidimicrobiia bacterium]